MAGLEAQLLPVTGQIVDSIEIHPKCQETFMRFLSREKIGSERNSSADLQSMRCAAEELECPFDYSISLDKKKNEMGQAL